MNKAWEWPDARTLDCDDVNSNEVTLIELTDKYFRAFESWPQSHTDSILRETWMH